MSGIETFVQASLTGIGLGCIYALVAMGFALIYKTTDVLNFAAGQMALLGAYLVVILVSIAVPPYLAVVVTLLLGMLLGLVLERVVFRHFIGEPVLSIVIVTLALGAIIRGAVNMTGGGTFVSYPETLLVTGRVEILYGANLSGPFALGVVAALASVLVLTSFFKYTVVGATLEAAAGDQQAALSLGVSIRRTIAISWIIASLITFVGGILLATARGGSAMEIEVVGIIILAAVVIGGVDSIKGAFVGSIVVGLVAQYGQVYAAPIIGPGINTVLPLLLLLVVLLVKPYGIWGTERIERL